LNLAFELRNIDVVRKYLANYSQYFAYEGLHYSGQIDFDFGKDLGIVYQKIPFDFYEFDKYWVKQMFKEKNKWNMDMLLSKIYESLMLQLYPTKTDTKYQMGMGTPNFKNYECGIEYANVKVINVVRKIEDILAVRITRAKNSHVSMDSYAPSLKQALGNKEIEKILYWELANNRLGIKYPQKVMNISFDDLVNKQLRPIVMNKTLEFLKLDQEPINKFWSIGGYELKKNNKGYLDNIYTDSNMLDNIQRKIIKREMLKFKIKNKIKEFVK
jgi:hypothetical protein